MSVVRVGEIWDGRKGSLDEHYVRRYTRVFRVITSAPTDGPEVAQSAAGVPQLGTWWTDGSQVDVGARVVSIEPQQDQDDPSVWRVQVEYSSDVPQGSNRDPALWTAYPITRPPEVTFSFEAYKTVAITDTVTGVAITNSAGSPFDPPLEVDDHRLVLSIEWNDLLFDALEALQILDGVNEDGFLGLAPGQCKIRKWGGELKYENGIVYFRRSCEIEIRLEGFAAQVLDAGFQVIDGAGKLATAELNGQPYSSPVLLDGAGGQLAVGGTPVYRTFNVYRGINYGGLGIPSF